jgi:hypothetical protein
LDFDCWMWLRKHGYAHVARRDHNEWGIDGPVELVWLT